MNDHSVIAKTRKKKSRSSNISGFSGDSVVKNPLANAGDTGLIPGLGRCPGGGNYLLQYSCMENPIDKRLVGYSP